MARPKKKVSHRGRFVSTTVPEETYDKLLEIMEKKNIHSIYAFLQQTLLNLTKTKTAKQLKKAKKKTITDDSDLLG